MNFMWKLKMTKTPTMQAQITASQGTIINKLKNVVRRIKNRIGNRVRQVTNVVYLRIKICLVSSKRKHFSFSHFIVTGIKKGVKFSAFPSQTTTTTTNERRWEIKPFGQHHQLGPTTNERMPFRYPSASSTRHVWKGSPLDMFSRVDIDRNRLRYTRFQ